MRRESYRSNIGFCFKWQRIFFFFGFIVKLDFLFFYLFSNAGVENCGSFKSFGFIYIYIYRLPSVTILIS